MCTFAKYGTEKYIKALAGLGGKKDIEHALQRLDMLTKEEAMIVGASNLEHIQHLESNMRTFGANTQDTKEVVRGLASGAQTVFLASCACVNPFVSQNRQFTRSTSKMAYTSRSFSKS